MLRLRDSLHRLRGWGAGRAARPRIADESGAVTIEFAVLVPLLFILIVGAAEYVNAIDNRNKVSALTRTLAELTSQGDGMNPISASLMGQITGAAEPVLAPFPASGATMKLAAIGVYSDKGQLTPFICSSWPAQSAAQRKDASKKLAIPSIYGRAGARYISAEVSMDYQPLFEAFLTRFLGPLDLTFSWNESLTWPARGGVEGESSEREIVFPGGQVCPAKL